MHVLTKERIALEVIRTLYSRFESFPANSDSNRNDPFLHVFLDSFTKKLEEKGINDPKYLIGLKSWIHGLMTTLGQSFIENVAHIVSGGAKMDFTEKNNLQLKYSKEQSTNINTIITRLKNKEKTPNVTNEDQLIFNQYSPQELTEKLNFTVDLYKETDTDIISIELKSVRPNAGEVRGEKLKVLQAKAMFFNRSPNKNIKFYFGFPFDPTSSTPTGYNKTKFLDNLVDGQKYLDPDEVLIASDLWDFLSGESNTMQQILDIVAAIATSDFESNYKKINDLNYSNENRVEVVELLNKWYLVSEQEIQQNRPAINEYLESSHHSLTSVQTNLNKSPFNSLAKYNHRRYSILKLAINAAANSPPKQLDMF